MKSNLIIGQYYWVQISFGDEWFVALYKENGYFDILSGNYRIDQVDWEFDEFDNFNPEPIKRMGKEIKEDDVDIRIGGC